MTMPADDEPNENEQIVDPAISGEDMDAFIAQLESGYEGNVNLSSLLPQDQQQDQQEEEQEEEPPLDEEPIEEEIPSDFFTVNGNQVPRSDIERLYQFDQYMRANPDVAQRVSDAMSAGAQPVPQPTGQPNVSATAPPAAQANTFESPSPPEALDLDDPRDKILWDAHVLSQRSAFENQQAIAQMQAQYNNDRQQQLNRQAAVDMESALSRFQSTFPNLNADDVAQVRSEAAPLVPAMMAQNEPVNALYKAMEVAAFANADIRQRIDAEPKPTNQERSRSRKQRLGSISGSPRSAPKTNEGRPQYTSDRDMVKQLADAIAQEGLNR
jgi:hypothetical protein